MYRYCLLLLGLALGLCRVAQAVDELSVIYDGDKQLSKRLDMGFWGYRPVSEAEGNPFIPVRISATKKNFGLHIITLGRYEGVRFDFLEPLDLTPILAEKNAFLEVYLRGTGNSVTAPITPATPPYGTSPDGSGAGPMAPQGMPGMMRRGLPPAMMKGLPSNQNIPAETTPPPTSEMLPITPSATKPNGDEAFPTDLSQAIERKPITTPMPQLKNIRMTFYTEKGQGVMIVPADQFYPKDEIDRTWIRIGIPLTELGKNSSMGGKLYRMVISSDDPAEFYIGRMAFVRDDDPIVVNMFIYPPFLEAKKSIFMASRVEAGLTPYEVKWDFDSKNRDTVDAMGERVTYTYAAEGLYTITCTVRDTTGGKPPATSTMDVKISRPFEEE